MKNPFSKITLILLLTSLIGCGATFHPIETSTKAGDPVTQVEVKKIGKRNDVPVGVKDSNVVSIVTTTSGAKVYVVKKAWHTPTVYVNKEAQAEGITVTQPKSSHLWIWATTGVILLLAVAAVVIQFYFGGLIAFFKKL
jgi:predicted small lipoprotein YifL